MFVAEPTEIADVGTYLIALSLTDSLEIITSTFTVTIPNIPPRFISDLPNHSLRLNTFQILYFSSFLTDDDLNPITSSFSYSFNGQPS